MQVMSHKHWTHTLAWRANRTAKTLKIHFSIISLSTMWWWETNVLICSPNNMTDATVERTMAAAAEKPFMMLSVYFTTTDVYRPPTLAKTESAKSNVSYNTVRKSETKIENILWFSRTYILQSTPKVCSRRRSLSPGPFHHRSCTHRSEWPQCRTGTSGCFSPTEMCQSSSTPSRSTHLNQKVNICKYFTTGISNVKHEMADLTSPRQQQCK